MNRKYNICTIASDIYDEFLFYFVDSCIKNCNNVEKIHILYTGVKIPNYPILNNKQIKLHILEKNIPSTQNIHDENWLANVDSKSVFFKKISSESSLPTFLIDVDSYFIKDFINLIDTNKDLVFCKRNHTLPLIASFVGIINNNVAVNFIDSWRNIMKRKSGVKETNSLVEFDELERKNYNIQYIEDEIISSTNFKNPNPDICIFHFKGRRIGDVNSQVGERIKLLKEVVNHV